MKSEEEHQKGLRLVKPKTYRTSRGLTLTIYHATNEVPGFEERTVFKERKQIREQEKIRFKVGRQPTRIALIYILVKEGEGLGSTRPLLSQKLDIWRRESKPHR